jgi:hypothetical protein
VKRKHTVLAWLIGSVGVLALLLAYPVGNGVRLESQRRHVEEILNESLAPGIKSSVAEAILKGKGIDVNYGGTTSRDNSHGFTYFEPTLITLRGTMQVKAEYWFDELLKLIQWKVSLDPYP